MSCAFWDAVGFLRHPLGDGRYGTGPLSPCPSAVIAGLQAGCPRASQMALHVVFRQLHWAPGQYSQKSLWINSAYPKADTKGGKQLLWHLMPWQRVCENHASLQIWHRPYRRPVPLLECCLEVRWDVIRNVKWPWVWTTKSPFRLHWLHSSILPWQ